MSSNELRNALLAIWRNLKEGRPSHHLRPESLEPNAEWFEHVRKLNLSEQFLGTLESLLSPEQYKMLFEMADRSRSYPMTIQSTYALIKEDTKRWPHDPSEKELQEYKIKVAIGAVLKEAFGLSEAAAIDSSDNGKAAH